MSLAFNRRAGTARLCFLAENAFVGVAELELDGGLVAVQLTGTEAAKECAREMCYCCPEMSFRVTVAGTPLRGGRQSFVALDKALGDHAAFEGRSLTRTGPARGTPTWPACGPSACCPAQPAPRAPPR